MAGSALKLPGSERPVDINEASADELRQALPGIGEVLASRIVAYREEHGPFESANDLSRVPGINDKRVSLMASRISVIPPNSGSYRRSPSQPSVDSQAPSRRFSINSDAFPGSFAPSLDSLLPRRLDDGHRASISPSIGPVRSDIGGAILSAAPPARTPTTSPDAPVVERVVDDVDAYLQIPLSRPWRIWAVLAGLALVSALAGAIAGVRSQEGGPKGALERTVSRVQNDVATVSGSVHQLESQATTFADSINALDARLTEQEHKTNPRAKVGSYATAKTPEKTQPARPSEESPVRRRVREAMTEFESTLPPSAAAR